MGLQARVHIDKVVEDFYVLRVDDEQVKYFEALWHIPEGITYNSYVLYTDEGVVVFDSWKHTYADLFIESLRKVADLRDIKYIVIHHMEQDHSGSIPKLLEAIGKDVTVLGHTIVKNELLAFYGVEPKFRAVKDLEVIGVGNKKLKFIYIPWLHWPDTIATYVEDLKVLLTCDAFGGYGLPKTLYDEDEGVVREYLRFVRKYVATVVGHYREHIVKDIEKILSLNLDVKVVAPAHGLIWKNNPKTIIDYYYKLGKAEAEKGKVLVVYDSMYGLVAKSMEVVIEELRSRGFRVEVFAFTDKEQAPLSNILGEAIDAEAIVIGVSAYETKLFPTIEYVIKMLIHKINSEKPVLIINTYGWGKILENYVKSLFANSRFKLVDIINVHGLPKREDVEKITKSIQKLHQ